MSGSYLDGKIVDELRLPERCKCTLWKRKKLSRNYKRIARIIGGIAMNILLVCAAGMSTSLLVNRMNEAAAAKGIELHIEAHPVGSIDQYGDSADVILLGPQVRYELKNVKAKYPGKPVETINMQDYGMMNGAKVLDFALELGGK